VVLTLRQLSDENWTQVQSVIPGKPGDTGCSGKDNRLFLDAVLWIARTGSPWRDLPPEFGKWYTAYTRFRRWTKNNVWPSVLATLAQDPAFEFCLVDGEICWKPRASALESENVRATPGERPLAQDNGAISFVADCAPYPRAL
jgi:putative transposase